MAMNRSSEMILDALLRAGAETAEEQLMQNVDRLDAAVSDETAVSGRHKAHIAALLRKKARKKRLRSALPAVKYAAAAIAASIALIGTLTLGVGAIRSSFLQYSLVDGKPTADPVTAAQEGQTIYFRSADVYELGYIPKGFELAIEKVGELKFSAYYRYEKGDSWFCVNISPLGGHGGVDTEDATIKDVTVGKYEGVYISGPKRNSLIWSNGYHAFTMHGNISKRKLLKIAKNIKTI